MSYVRMNYFEYISEEAGDELEAHYIKNAPKNFDRIVLFLIFYRRRSVRHRGRGRHRSFSRRRGQQHGPFTPRFRVSFQQHASFLHQNHPSKILPVRK